MRDLIYSIRTLVRRPGFTTVAIVTLALGIGVNTAIFSLVNALVFRPLPVANPGELVRVFNTGQSLAFLTHLPLSELDFKDYRDQNQVFSGITAYLDLPALLRNGETSELVSGEVVTGNYFDVLGVKPVRGRLLTADDDQPSATPVTVLSYRTWQRRFNGNPSILDQPVELNGQKYAVVGIVPDEFKGMLRVVTSEYWVPMSSLEGILGKEFYSLLQGRRVNQYQTIGRLKPGVGFEQAVANLETIAKQLEQSYPDTNKGRGATALWLNDVIFDPAADTYIKAASLTVMILSSIVLVIACANLANLTLARAITMRKEIAVRLALGGSRGRLIRQVVTESVVLALAGGAAGLLVAIWSNRFLNVVRLPIPIEVALGLSLDARVVAFAIAVSLLTGLIFGLIPAWRAIRIDVFPALKDEGRSASGGQRRVSLRNGLVVAQVTLSLVLLIVAGLAVRSLQNAGLVDPGFDPENLVVGSLDLRLNQKTSQQGMAFYRDLMERLNTAPGVESASLVSSPPLSLSIRLTRFAERQGVPEQETKLIDTTKVWRGYFRTMDIPVLKGRDFSPTDTDTSPDVAVINETMARTQWPNEDPIGKRFFVGFPQMKPVEVIGVVRDGKYRTLGEDPRPFVYTTFQQTYEGSSAVIVRAAGGTPAGIATLRNTIQSLDPTLTIFALQPMKDVIGVSLLLPQYVAGLFGVFGLLGAGLAIVGLYGVVAYSVSQRTQELGIRMALGGQRADVLKLVLSQGMKLTAVGLVIGLIIAVVTTRLLAGILYGIGATDPITFGSVSALMIAVTLAACYIPARRATKIDPMVALRHE